MPLPWIASSLADDVSNWGFTNRVNSAMSTLSDMGSRLMQPVGQQLGDVLQQSMPMPQPAPSPPVPSVPRFDLGKPEDWLGTPSPPPQPISLQQPSSTPPAGAADGGQAPTGGGIAPRPSAGFALPPISSYLPSFGAPTTPAAPAAPAAAGAAAGADPVRSMAVAGGNKADFLRTAGPIAARVEQETGIPAKLSLAISANETGWGNPRYTPGNAFHGIQAQRGEAGTGYTDVTAAGTPYQASLRSFGSPYDAFRGFADFLTQNSRYAPALAQYRQSGDLNGLVSAIKAAGYAEDPAYTQKITSIMSGIPDIPVPAATAPPAAPPPAPAAPPSAVPGMPGRQVPGPGTWGAYDSTSLVPNQLTEGTAQGLSTQQALAICGPAAAT